MAGGKILTSILALGGGGYRNPWDFGAVHRSSTEILDLFREKMGLG